MTQNSPGIVSLPYISRELASEYDVSFFVPCLNEAGNIGLTLHNIIAVARAARLTFEILVFDDASSDGTLSEIRSVMKTEPAASIRLVLNEQRRGLARNYVDGAYLARGRHYMLVNGDNAEPPETIRAILDQLGKADIIIPVFKENDTRTAKRRTISRTFTKIVNTISGNNINYYNGPALHLRYNVMRWHADTDGFAYQAEIITRLAQEGATYIEVVVKNADRQHGSSSALNMKNLLAIGHSLFQISMRRLRHHLYYRERAPAKVCTLVTDADALPTLRGPRGTDPSVPASH